MKISTHSPCLKLTSAFTTPDAPIPLKAVHYTKKRSMSSFDTLGYHWRKSLNTRTLLQEVHVTMTCSGTSGLNLLAPFKTLAMCHDTRSVAPHDKTEEKKCCGKGTEQRAS